MKTNIQLAIAICAFGLLLSVLAQTPQTTDFQGRLNGPTGAPLFNDPANAADGQIDLTFRIYDAATNGNVFWSETHTNVAVYNGLFSVLLSGLNETVFPATNQISRWLEVQVAANGITNTLWPRKEIVSVAYALQAGNADTLDGRHAGDFVSSNELAAVNGATNFLLNQVIVLQNATDVLNLATNVMQGQITELTLATNNLQIEVGALNAATNNLNDKVLILQNATNNLQVQIVNLQTATNALNLATNALQAQIAGMGEKFIRKWEDDFTVGLLTISNNLVVKTNLLVETDAVVWGMFSVLTNELWVSGTNIITNWPHGSIVGNLNADMLDGYHAADIVVAATNAMKEVDPTVTNWVKDGVSWTELKSQGMPVDFADDIDNVGVTNWAQLKAYGMPAGFTDDVDNVGIIVEVDPRWLAASNAIVDDIASRLASNVWSAADSTTNYLARTGGTMSGALNMGGQIVTNAAYYGDGRGLTNLVETDPTVVNWVKDGESWNELKGQGMPADFADDVDNVGLTNEVDPTVVNWVKDGESWTELKSQGMPPDFADDIDNVGVTNWAQLKAYGMPAGFTDDVDDVGITVESDPQVGIIANNYVPRWDVTNLVTGNIYNDPNNGNVGIGTSSPDTTLDVNGNIWANGSRPIKLNPAGSITIQAGPGGWADYLHFLGSSGTDRGGFGAAGSDDNLTYLYAGDSYSNPTMVWKAGNVGVGTASPGARLHVSGGAVLLGAASAPEWDTNTRLWTEGGFGARYDGYAHRFDIGGSRTEAMRITAGGSVGIGTPAPEYKLDVNGNISIRSGNFLRLWGSGQGNATLQYMGSGAGAYVRLEAGDSDAWRPVALAPSGGNVGIGTTTPAYKLDLIGDAVIRGVHYLAYNDNRIEALWGDYRYHPYLALTAADGYSVLKPGPTGFRVTNYRNEPPNNLELKDVSGDLWIKGTYHTISDSRMKANQEPLEYGLPEVLELNPMRFIWVNWTMDPETGEIEIEESTATKDFGLIAQDVYEVMPEAVKKPKDESTECWSLAYDKLIAVLAKAIQEQQAQIEELKKEIQTIKSGN